MKPETAGNAPEPKLDDICGTCGQRYGLHARMSCPFPDGREETPPNWIHCHLLLRQANNLLRSAYEIAKRDGKATNWVAFRNRVHKGLIAQHEYLYPKADAGAKSVVAAPQNEISQWIDTELWNFAHALALDLGVSHDAAGDKSKEELIHRSMSAVIGICLRMAGAAALPSQEPK